MPAVDFDPCASTATHDCTTYCVGPSKLPCNTCQTTPSGYICECPASYMGDARSFGTGCWLERTNYERVEDYFGHTSTVVVISVIIGLAIWISYLLMKRRRRNRLRDMFFRQNGGLDQLPLLFDQYGISSDLVREFTPEELHSATAGFHRSGVIGVGGQAKVFRGTLGGNIPVAVKVPKKMNAEKRREFFREIAILSRMNHRHVVKLLGYCLRVRKPALIFEYLSNGNLSEHLHESEFPLSWINRMKVVVDVASAIQYLHSDASTMVLHKDIKSANVLLEENFSAKLSDFGYSRIVPGDQSQIKTSTIVGTPGCIDPQFRQCGVYSKQSDIYSLGIMLAEILTRKLPFDETRTVGEGGLGKYFKLMYEGRAFFKILDDQVIKQARREIIQATADLTIRCLHDDPEQRPDIEDVKTELSRLLEAQKLSDSELSSGSISTK